MRRHNTRHRTGCTDAVSTNTPTVPDLDAGLLGQLQRDFEVAAAPH